MISLVQMNTVLVVQNLTTLSQKIKKGRARAIKKAFFACVTYKTKLQSKLLLILVRNLTQFYTGERISAPSNYFRDKSLQQKNFYYKST